MRKTIAFLMVVILIVAGIVIRYDFSPRIDTGTVIAKNYEPARTVTQFIYKDGYMYTVPHTYPAEWDIQVQGVDSEGNRSTEWWSVDETTYHKVTIGDTVQRNR